MGNITTYSGLWVDPLNIQPNQITIRDIAYPLSHICRFGGHVQRFYSVAEHCLIGSRIMEERTKSKMSALVFLLHDAAEAFIGDIVGPIKNKVVIDGKPVGKIEESLLLSIFEGLGLLKTTNIFSYLQTAEVKNLDTEMCQAEQRVLTYHHRQPQPATEIVIPLEPTDPDTIAEHFIGRFYDLSYSIAER